MSKAKNNLSWIFTTYRIRLLNFIRNRVETADDAQDILQDVFLKMIVSSGSNDISHVSAWLYRTARNRIADHYRKHREMRLEQMLEKDVADMTECLAGDENDQEKDFIRNLIWSRLNASLGRLPEKQRWVFIETEIKGVSFKELSARTGLSVTLFCQGNTMRYYICVNSYATFIMNCPVKTGDEYLSDPCPDASGGVMKWVSVF